MKCNFELFVTSQSVLNRQIPGSYPGNVYLVILCIFSTGTVGRVVTNFILLKFN